MATVLFKDTTHQVADLVTDIRRGEIALPDLQRPYVWQPTKARELFDSMYKGFPVGYLLFWETGVEAGARQIGEGAKPEAARKLIVDGQQRLTSLFAVMTGAEVLREDYRLTRIRLAFRPADATFAVTDAAIEKDPEYLPDISVLWDSATSRRKVTREFLTRLNNKRGIAQEEEDQIQDALDRLYDLASYPFKGVVLSSEVDEEQVAEVFVRINSEGVKLDQADFILTLTSVFWEDGRRALEEFCRAARTPSTSTPSPFNWYIKPKRPSCSESSQRWACAAPYSGRCTPPCVAATRKPAGSRPPSVKSSSGTCGRPRNTLSTLCTGTSSSSAWNAGASVAKR